MIGSPQSMSLWIFGDGKGCVPRVRFVDSTEQMFQSTGPKIDWKGWREVKFPMQRNGRTPLEFWDGADDGTIHYPIEFDSIFLLENAERVKVEGEIFISVPTRNY